MKRYQRQILLDEVGVTGQRALSQARILIIGAGGLGTPAALYLAAAGIKELTLVDGDNVDESNLHRQVLFTDEDLGQNKAAALAYHLKIRSQSKINYLGQYLDQPIALQIFPEYDMIIDGTDNFAAKYLINDIAVLYRKPVVYGAISHFEGRVSVFGGSHDQPCYRCLFPESPKSKIQNCAEAGVLGPLPGIIGTLQAMEAIKWILSETVGSSLKPLKSRLQILSFANNDSQILPVTKKKDCFCCIPEPTIDDLPERPQPPLCSLSIPAKVDLSEKTILDVRTQEEWDDFHIENSLHWPLARFNASDFPKLNSKDSYMIVCKSGVRAKRALELMKDNNKSMDCEIVAYTGSIYDLAFN